MPTALRVRRNGIELTFSDPLDAKESSDPQSFSIEQWNYRWIARYGSPSYSVKNPESEGRDTVPVEAVNFGPDRKTLFLQTPPLKPVMQMRINYNIDAKDKPGLKGQIFNSIYNLAPAPLVDAGK